MSKANKLKASASFSSAARSTSTRRQLIAQATGEAPADPTKVPLEQLVGNPDNPRQELGDLEELANSLLKHGLRQPVGVMPRGAFVEVYPQHEKAVEEASFVVINGNRRLAAARLAGLPTLAVHLTGLTGSDLASVRAAVLVENIHRKDLEPLEEARAVAELVELHGTQAEAAEQVGKTQGWVSQRLSLLNLVPELQQDLASGELKVKEARSLARLTPQEQLQARERSYYPVMERGDEGSSSEEASAGAVTDKSARSFDGKEAGAPGRSGARNSDSPEPVQLTLDLEWEPRMAASEIVTVYGRERAEELAAAILEQL